MTILYATVFILLLRGRRGRYRGGPGLGRIFLLQVLMLLQLNEHLVEQLNEAVRIPTKKKTSKTCTRGVKL